VSYLSRTGGSSSFGGFGYHSLGADYPIRRNSESTLSLQRQLVRLQFLQPDESRFGADAVWGPQTAGSLVHAARYVGWTGAVYSPPDADRLRTGTVTVSDDLITRLRSAQPAPTGTPGAVAPSRSPEAGASVDPGTTIGPRLATPAANVVRTTGWVPSAVIGGSVLLLGGFIAWSMRKKKPSRKRTVRANRRR
jgi:hypothetical protein